MVPVVVSEKLPPTFDGPVIVARVLARLASPATVLVFRLIAPVNALLASVKVMVFAPALTDVVPATTRPPVVSLTAPSLLVATRLPPIVPVPRFSEPLLVAVRDVVATVDVHEQHRRRELERLAADRGDRDGALPDVEDLQGVQRNHGQEHRVGAEGKHQRRRSGG